MNDKGHDMPNKREDDKFLRKVIWFIGGLALTSAASIIAMQVQINANKEAVKQIKETNKTLNEINLTLQKVFSSGKYRNRILVSLEKRQTVISAEQQRRTTTVYDAAKHMKNRGIHR